MATALIVVLVLVSIYLTWRLVSDRRAKQPERARHQSEIDSYRSEVTFLQFRISLANRLLARNHDLSRDVAWQMWSGGTPEEQQNLAAFLDRQDALKKAAAESIDPPPPF